MTIKEIVEVSGCSESSVRRKVNELFPGFMETGKKKRLNQKQAIEVMSSLRKKGFVQPLQNGGEPLQNGEASTLTKRDMELIGGIVAQVMAQMNNRVEKIEERIEQRQALLPPPQIKPRDHINMIVRQHVKDTGKGHRDVWGELYKNFSYRTNSNPRECAKNRDMPIIEYIESEGQIEILEAIAMEIF